MEIQRTKRGYRLTQTQRLAQPLETVFPFFSDAGNLETLTPARMRFRVLTPRPIVMRQGLLIDYALRVGGLPVRWQSEITIWDPPHRFADEQRRGPYRWWIHEHRFEPDGDGTLAHDTVDYSVPGGALAHRLFVRRSLEQIFRYRAEKLVEFFGA